MCISPKQLGEEARLPDGDELTLKVQRRIRWDSAGRATSAVAEPANRCRRITGWSDRRSVERRGVLLAGLNRASYVGGMMRVRLPPGRIPAIPSSQPLIT